MNIDSSLQEHLGNNINLKRSNAGKIILNFESSETSNNLFKFLKFHLSMRLILSALIKSRFDLDDAWEKLNKIIEKQKISFMKSATCHSCNELIETLHILDDKTHLTHSISCPHCSTKNILSSKDYIYVINPYFENFIRVLLYCCKLKILSQNYVYNCFKCGSIFATKENEKLKSICPKCKEYLYLSTQFFPLYEEFENLTKDENGYWLDWYVWRLLDKKGEIGVEVISDKNHFECDIIKLIRNKRVIIECKDTNNDDHFLSKLASIKKVCDFYVLVSSVEIKQDTINTIEEIMDSKFIYIEPKQIENIQKILKQKIK